MEHSPAVEDVRTSSTVRVTSIMVTQDEEVGVVMIKRGTAIALGKACFRWLEYLNFPRALERVEVNFLSGSPLSVVVCSNITIQNGFGTAAGLWALGAP